MLRWVNYINGVPIADEFATLEGYGAAFCINQLTGTGYYLAPGSVVTALAGSGGGGSGTFALDDGTAAATGVFSFDEGGA